MHESRKKIIQILTLNMVAIYCQELALGTVSLASDWTQGNDSKQYVISNEMCVFVTYN